MHFPLVESMTLQTRRQHKQTTTQLFIDFLFFLFIPGRFWTDFVAASYLRTQTTAAAATFVSPLPRASAYNTWPRCSFYQSVLSRHSRLWAPNALDEESGSSSPARLLNNNPWHRWAARLPNHSSVSLTFDGWIQSSLSLSVSLSLAPSLSDSLVLY